jgi:hypothetical protein
MSTVGPTTDPPRDRNYLLERFPGEIFRAPRSWAEEVYPNLSYLHEVDGGGLPAAWEAPQLFSAEPRAAFSSLR